MKLSSYKEFNGIRVFDKDFKVRRGTWNEETIGRCSIIKMLDEEDKGYYLVRAYAVKRDSNKNLRAFYDSSLLIDAGYEFMSGMSELAGVGFFA